MGFFSKTCAKSHLPIIHEARGFPRLSKVVALLPSGEIVRGFYDGYGRVGGVDLHEDWDKVKLVIESEYEGESYKDLPKSGNELGQGHFMSDQFLLYCLINKRFKSRSEYTRAFKRLANW
jgi:hypothetical protein